MLDNNYHHEFDLSIIHFVWERQNEKCAKCGVSLIFTDRDNEDGVAPWRAHNLVNEQNYSWSEHCAILCIGLPNNCSAKVQPEQLDPFRYYLQIYLELPYIAGKLGRRIRLSKEYRKYRDTIKEVELRDIEHSKRERELGDY